MDENPKTDADIENGGAILKELEALAKVVAPCFQCTTCASSCPVFQTDPDRTPRKIVQRLSKGDLESVLDDVEIWWCGGCYSCETHCPQGVSLTEVLFQLKNLSFKSGREIPQNILRNGKMLAQGFLISVNKSILEKRKSLDLPEIQMPDTDEIGALLEATGFTSRLNLKTK